MVSTRVDEFVIRRVQPFWEAFRLIGMNIMLGSNLRHRPGGHDEVINGQDTPINVGQRHDIYFSEHDTKYWKGFVSSRFFQHVKIVCLGQRWLLLLI